MRSTHSASVRDLLQYGITVERDLEAQELRQHYASTPMNRDAENARLNITASINWLSPREMAEIEAAIEEAMGY
jgi:hypothetical protein